MASRDDSEQRERGYRHTLREICQQPDTWLATAAAVRERASEVAAFLRQAGVVPGHGLVVLTGSEASSLRNIAMA